MYDGPEVDPSKQAVIRGEQTAERKIVIIVVDGSRTSNFFEYMGHGWATEIAVLPGRHTLAAEVQYQHPFSSLATTWLWVATEPGETYVIKARSRGYATKVFVENERTGKIAGGYLQNDDKPADCPSQCKEPTGGEVPR